MSKVSGGEESGHAARLDTLLMVIKAMYDTGSRNWSRDCVALHQAPSVDNYGDADGPPLAHKCACYYANVTISESVALSN